MAKKEITARSTAVEVRTAYEQLAKAQQEFNDLYKQYSNKSITAGEYSRLAGTIASKYDYVAYGQPMPKGSSNEIFIGGDKFYVPGLTGGDVTYNSSATPRAAVNGDDGYVTANPNTAVTNNSPKPAGQNPNDPSRLKGQDPVKDPAKTTDSTNLPKAQAEQDKVSPNSELTQSSEAVKEKKATEVNSSANNGIVEEEGSNAVTASGNSTSSKNQTDDKGKINSKIEGSESNLNGTSPDTANSRPTGDVSVGTTSSINLPSSYASGTQNANVPIRSNVLHKYANWTYKIGWYMLSPDEYNSIILGAEPTNLNQPIAVSGGAAKAGGSNTITQEGDIYIKSLRFTSIIGNRLEGAATNNFDLEMVVFEPYGASLMGSIAVLAQEVGGNSTTLSDIPYLLSIDFLGYTDSGDIVTSILQKENGKKKYIPVKVYSVDMNLQAGGASYTLRMIPYSFDAFTPKNASITGDVTVTGATVNEILRGAKGLSQALNDLEQAKIKNKYGAIPDNYEIIIHSFDGKGKPTTEMENSPVAFPLKGSNSSAGGPMASGLGGATRGIDNARSQASASSGPKGGGGNVTQTMNRPMDKNDPTTQSYSIKGGTFIKDAIKSLVQASEYFNRKVDPKNPNKKKEPAELLKVIPEIKLAQWDASRNEYQKYYTYHVFNTLEFGEIYPYVGQALVSEWGWNKEYFYFFTGKNEDILNLDINFNLLYFSKFLPSLNERSKIIVEMDTDTEKTEPSARPVGALSAPGSKSSEVTSTAPNQPARYINSMIVSEWFDNKMNNAYTDNISLEMSIIGDPDWIPQDASIRGGEFGINSTRTDRNGSVAVDIAGVYTKINFRSPRDYNDKTGLMNINLDQVITQGVYKVITVESVFEDGKFTQNFNAVKVPNSVENDPGSFGSSQRQQYNAAQGRGGAAPVGADPLLRNSSLVNTNANPTTTE